MFTVFLLREGFLISALDPHRTRPVLSLFTEGESGKSPAPSDS